MNLVSLALGVAFLLVGITGIASSRQSRGVPTQSPGKPKSSPLVTLWMFFLGLGFVLVLVGL